MAREKKQEQESHTAATEGGDASAPAEVAAIELSDEAAALIEQLERERDEAIEGRKRALADFSNFTRRSRENEARSRQDGINSIVRSLLPVIDHFDLALQQDQSALTVEQLLGGVKIVYAELMKALEAQGLKKIDPAPGDAFDPMQHEAMLRQPCEGVAPNHVVEVLQPGYAAGDIVLRPAKVSVAPEES